MLGGTWSLWGGTDGYCVSIGSYWLILGGTGSVYDRAGSYLVFLVLLVQYIAVMVCAWRY